MVSLAGPRSQCDVNGVDSDVEESVRLLLKNKGLHNLFFWVDILVNTLKTKTHIFELRTTYIKNIFPNSTSQCIGCL